MTSGAPQVRQAAASASDETSLLPLIVELEERITNEQLSLFKEQTGEWQGPEHVRDLYNLWLSADIQARELVTSDDLPGKSTNETREDILSFPISHQPQRRGRKKQRKQ